MLVGFENHKPKRILTNRFFYFQITTIFLLLIIWLIYKSDIKQQIWCNVIRDCIPEESQNEYFEKVISKLDEKFISNIIEDIKNIEQSKILIISLPRSGSSFLGEIFNQNNDVFFIYEPLHTQKILSGLQIAKQARSNAVTFINDLFQCNFQQHRDYFEFISNPDLSNPHFRLTSQVLSSPPFCLDNLNNTVSLETYKNACGLIDAKYAEERCLKTPNVAIKDLIHRFPNGKLSDVIKLLDDKKLRIVYLVRDPRAILSSMKSIGWFGDNIDTYANKFRFAINEVCESFKESNEFIKRSKHLFYDRLIVIRYEDLVSQPEESLDYLFWFNNIQLKQSHIDWVIENTRGQFTNFNSNQSFSVLLKNATFSLNSWRHHLFYDEMTEIHDACGDVISEYGYTVFKTYGEMINMSIPTFNSNFNVSHALLVS